MKLKLFLATLFIIILSLGYSQNELEGYEVKKVEVLKRVGNKISSSNEGSILKTFKRAGFYYSIYEKYDKRNETFWVEKFDSDFNSIDKKQLDLSNVTLFEGIYELENDFVFTFVEREKSSYTLKCTKFNFKKFSFDTKPLYSKEITRRAIYFDNNKYVLFKPAKLSYSFLVSPDKKLFSIVESNYIFFNLKSTKTTVFKEDFSLLYEKDVDYSKAPKVGNLNSFREPLMKNNGMIYGVYMSINNRASGKAKSRIYSINKTETTFSEIMPNCFTNGLSDIIEGNNKLILNNDKLQIINLVGIERVNDLNKNQILQKMTLSDDGKKFVEVQKIQIEPVLGKGKERINSLAIKQILFSEDGSFFINLEGVQSYNSIINSTSGNSYNQYEIKIIKINKRGKIDWHNTIWKKQWSTVEARIGFAFYINYKNELCYIFNSNEKNYPDFKNKSGLDGSAQHVSLDSKNGKNIGNSLLRNQQEFKLRSEKIEYFGDSFVLTEGITYYYYSKK